MAVTEPLLSSQSRELDESEQQNKGGEGVVNNATPTHAPDRTVLGLASYAISSIFLASMLTCAKLLGKRKMPVFETLLARSSSILIIALLMCAKDKVNPFGNRRGLLAVRGIFGFGAIACYFWAIQLLPIQDAMVLTFLAPLWVALLGPFFLNEKPSRLVAVAIPACLVGVALITQPEFLGFKEAQQRNLWGILFASGQAFFSACAKMCVRELRKTETANVSVFYLSFCSTIGALVGTLAPKLFGVKESIRMPHDIEWLLLVGVGLTGYGTQICMTFALQNAKAAPAIAMSYLSVVWSLLSGILIFHEIPNWISCVGAALVCSCTLLLGVFEKKKKAGSEPVTQSEVQNDQNPGSYSAVPTDAPQEQR